MKLRPNWYRKLQEAKAFLEKIGTPIAKQTLAIINSGKVVINSYSNLTRKDFAELHQEYNEKNPHKAQKRSYPPSASFVKSVGEKWLGAIYGKRIYISPDLDVRKMAKIIVHEVNHFVNDSNHHMHTDTDTFIEELRANIAEKVALKPTLRFTPQYLQRKANTVIRNYELDLNASTVLTEEVKAKVLNGLR